MSTENVYPAASSDDGYGYAGYSAGSPSSGYNYTSTVAYLGETYVAPPPTLTDMLNTALIRLTNISADQAETINSALLYYYIATAAAATNIRIYGYDGYNPTMPTDYSGYTTFAANKTTAYASPGSSYFSSTGWHNIDVTSIVQEIVDRGDWVTGGALAFIFGQYGSVPENYNPSIRTYDYGSLYPYLYIDWTPSYTPLAASGYIGMGGSTADRSINIRKGSGATDTISLNDADVRALVGIGSGAISINDFHGV